MMTKLLITLATTVALVGPAAAGDQLPDKMLGDWCFNADHVVYTRPCGSDGVRITVKRDEFSGNTGYGSDAEIENGEGFGCKFKAVLRVEEDYYFIRTRCESEGTSYNDEMVFRMNTNGWLDIVPTTRTRLVYYVCGFRNGGTAYVNVENKGKRVMVQVRDRDAHDFPVTKSTSTSLVFSRGAFNYPTRSNPSFSLDYVGGRYECDPRSAHAQAWEAP
jgi:hypothetical protein